MIPFSKLKYRHHISVVTSDDNTFVALVLIEKSEKKEVSSRERLRMHKPISKATKSLNSFQGEKKCNRILGIM